MGVYGNDNYTVAEAIRATVVPITLHIHTTVMSISRVIGKTVMRIACTGDNYCYRHDRSMRLSENIFHQQNLQNALEIALL